MLPKKLGHLAKINQRGYCAYFRLKPSPSLLALGDMPLPMFNSTIVCDVSTDVPCLYVPPSLRCAVFEYLHSLSHPAGYSSNTTSGHSTICVAKHKLRCQKMGTNMPTVSEVGHTATHPHSILHLSYTRHSIWSYPCQYCGTITIFKWFHIPWILDYPNFDYLNWVSHAVIILIVNKHL